MMAAMRLPSALSFLVDKAIDVPDGDAFLTALAARLVADGVPLTGGALTQAAPHPVIERRIWLWRADTGRVIEALGLAGPLDPGPAQPTDIARNWLAGLGTGSVQEDFAGSPSDGRDAGLDGEPALQRDRSPNCCARSLALPPHHLRCSPHARRYRRC